MNLSNSEQFTDLSDNLTPIVIVDELISFVDEQDAAARGLKGLSHIFLRLADICALELGG